MPTNVFIPDSVLAGDAHNGSITSHFKGRDFLFVVLFQCPCFAGVKEYGKHEYSQKPYLMLEGDGFVFPYFLQLL